MRQKKRFMLGFLLTSVGILMAGCNSVLSTPTATPNTQLTQMALQVEILQSQLGQVAPTLTAFAEIVQNSAVKEPTPEPNPENAQAPSPMPTRTSTPRAVPTLQATLKAAQVTSQAGLLLFTQAPGSLDETPTPQTLLKGFSLDLPMPTPFAPAGAVLLSDDFSSKSGWFISESDRFILEFVEDGYRVFVMTKNNPVWSTRTKIFEDVRLEVDAVQTKGPVDGYFGLICRQVDNTNYYLLVVSMDGTFGIAKVEDGEIRYLSFTNEYPDLLKFTGNRLRADCIGDNLALYVNDTKVLEANDGEYSSGGVGVVAGNRSTSGTDILFDNFIVINPTQ